MEAQAQRDENHQQQRAAVVSSAGFVIVRYVTAVLLTTSQLQIYEGRDFETYDKTVLCTRKITRTGTQIPGYPSIISLKL